MQRAGEERTWCGDGTRRALRGLGRARTCERRDRCDISSIL